MKKYHEKDLSTLLKRIKENAVPGYRNMRYLTYWFFRRLYENVYSSADYADALRWTNGKGDEVALCRYHALSIWGLKYWKCEINQPLAIHVVWDPTDPYVQPPPELRD